MSSRRRVWAEIDLDALRRNLALARGGLPRDTAVLGVVKANAYGHGAIVVSRALEEAGITMLGVGDAHEAIELRAAGIETPILVLGASLEQEIPALIEHSIIPTIHSPDRIATFAAAARRAGVQLPVHLLVDTGMSRLGVTPERALEHLRAIRDEPTLRLAGLGTHLASPEQEPFSREQIARIARVISDATIAGVRPPLVHIASSLPLDRYPDTCHDMVRLGGFLYGLRPENPVSGRLPHPVLSLRTEVAYLRDHPAGTAIGYGGTYVTTRRSRLATLPIGYHDGYPFTLSNRAEVLVRGARAPVVGRVTMDYVCVDVTDIPDVGTGDIATLIGEDGDDAILVGDLARWAGTISYEIPCRLGPRVDRIHLGLVPRRESVPEPERLRARWTEGPGPAREIPAREIPAREIPARGAPSAPPRARAGEGSHSRENGAG